MKHIVVESILLHVCHLTHTNDRTCIIYVTRLTSRTLLVVHDLMVVFFFRSICSVRSIPFSSSFSMRVTGMLSVLSPFRRGGYWGQIQLTLWAKAKLWLFWHWVCRVFWFYTLKHFIYPLFLSPTFFGIGVVLLKKSQEPKVFFFFF